MTLIGLFAMTALFGLGLPHVSHVSADTPYSVTYYFNPGAGHNSGNCNAMALFRQLLPVWRRLSLSKVPVLMLR
jgi:hypothetical protein